MKPHRGDSEGRLLRALGRQQPFPKSQALAWQGQDQNQAEPNSPAGVPGIPEGPWEVCYQVLWGRGAHKLMPKTVSLS